MKSILFIISGWITGACLHAQIVENAYTTFYTDSVYYIMDPSAIIRSSPDSLGMIMVKGNVGEPVKIIENSEVADSIRKIPSNWYKVKYNAMDEDITGYIWGGSLASKTILSSTDKSVMFMYRLWDITPKEYFDSLTIQVMLVKAGELIQDIKLKATGGMQTYNSAESLGNKGINSIKDIFKINFSDGFCAGAFADVYFFYNGKAISDMITLDEGFDAPYFATNTLIFPKDQKGKKNWIIQIEESGYVNDHDKTIIESFKKIFYKWNGNQLVKIRETDKR